MVYRQKSFFPKFTFFLLDWKDENDKIPQIFSDKLSSLLQTFSSNDRFLYCFDMKAANILVDLGQDTNGNAFLVDMKLTDWDSNFCYSKKEIPSCSPVQITQELKSKVLKIILASRILSLESTILLRSEIEQFIFDFDVVEIILCLNEDKRIRKMMMHYMQDETSHFDKEKYHIIYTLFFLQTYYLLVPMESVQRFLIFLYVFFF